MDFLAREELDALRRRVDLLETLVLRIAKGTEAPPDVLMAGEIPPPRSTLPRPPGFHDVDPSWIPILHIMQRDNSPVRPCGEVALYLTEPPQEHQQARLDIMRIWAVQGTHWEIPDPQNPRHQPRCASCGIQIDPFSNADLDYLSHMLPAPSPQEPKPAPVKRVRRRSSGGDAAPSSGPPSGSGVSGSFSPEALRGGLPSSFPAHTSDASQDVLYDLHTLQRLARDAGLAP